VTAASVSVIVPCHRYADVLDECVESVLAQDGVDVRVLIVDDCSPDHTPDVAARLTARDARVEYIRHADNHGLIATANEGLAWARGEAVVLLSADDLLTPGALRRATTVLRRFPGVGMVYGRALFARPGHSLPVAGGRWRATDVRDGRAWLGRRCRTASNPISSPEVVVRTTVQRAVGGYDPRCHHTSDLNMWLRIAAVSDVAYVRGVPQAVYRIHPDSMLRSDAGPLVDLRSRRAAFDCFFEDAGEALAGTYQLRMRAARALARQALWRASRAYDRGLVDDPGAVPVDELVTFAHDVYPRASELAEWRGLRVRKRIGAGRSGWFPPFLATGAAHRLHGHTSWLRWRLRGV